MNPFITTGGNHSPEANISTITSCHLPAQLFYIGCCADVIVNEITVVEYSRTVVTGQTIDLVVRVSTSAAVRRLQARFKLGADTFALAAMDLDAGLIEEDVPFSFNVTFASMPVLCDYTPREHSDYTRQLFWGYQNLI